MNGFGKAVFALSLLIVFACVSINSPNADTSPRTAARLRFQNMLGLKLYHAGCSFQNLGGVERMCQFATNNPADLVFQIGPSFTELLSEIQTSAEVQSKRIALWKVWEAQKVQFYAPDYRDFRPNLNSFLDSHKNSPIQLMSSNLVDSKGDYLFESFLLRDFSNKKVAFLGFSESSLEKTGKHWKVENIGSAFTKIRNQIESKVDIFYVLGSLSQETRKIISKSTERPVVFIGGALDENNTVSFEPVGTKDFVARAASFGRGFGEVAIGSFDVDFWGKKPQAKVSGLDHSFWSYLLEPVDLKFNECSKILNSAKPNRLPTEAVK